MCELENVLRSLKKNKSCDPYGLNNEVFRLESIGSDLKQALLYLYNEIQIKCVIPKLLHPANIITIYKFLLEETKLKKQGQINTKWSKNYYIFELLRKEKKICGGGLAIGVKKELEPTWVGEGDDDCEILVVQAKLKDINTRCIVGYGPQAGDSVEKKEKFWARLENEVKDAKEAKCAVLIHIDGNLHLGPDVIQGDPCQLDQNGKFFKQFLQNTQLFLLNSSSICQGKITRRRKTSKKTEESIIDFFLVCDQLFQFVKRLTIDEEKKHILTNYYKSNGVVKSTDSDHLTMILEMDLNYVKHVLPRKEIFNIKSQENLQKFKEITSNNTQLSSLITSKELGFEEKCSLFENKFFHLFKQSFPKVRLTGNKKETEGSKLIGQRNMLKQNLKTASEEEYDRIEKKIYSLEEKICWLNSEENMRRFKEDFEDFSNSDGPINSNGLWKIKRKLIPKHCSSLPA